MTHELTSNCLRNSSGIFASDISAIFRWYRLRNSYEIFLSNIPTVLHCHWFRKRSRISAFYISSVLLYDCLRNISIIFFPIFLFYYAVIFFE